MKYVIVSDSHGENDCLVDIYAHHKDADGFFHCGDSELVSVDEAIDMYRFVQGNCDLPNTFTKEQVIEAAPFRFLMVHGHLWNVKSSFLPLYYRAKEKKAHVVFFGHSHYVTVFEENGILFVNPGSISKPRGRVEKTYAVLENDDSKWIVSILTDSHELIEAYSLPFEIGVDF